jgi:hypothetical protein
MNTQTIYVLCKADGTPILIDAPCTAKAGALPKPLYWYNLKFAMVSLASGRFYGATQVTPLTWEVN